MTAPGDFTSGDVLTAADMNALPAGIVSSATRTTDLTMTTSPQDVFSVSYTPTGTRKIAVMCYVGSLDLPSTTNLGIFLLRDGAGNTGNVLQQSLVGAGPPTHQIMWLLYNTTINSTKIFYLSAYTSTGTLRMNTDSTKPMNMLVVDLGKA